MSSTDSAAPFQVGRWRVEPRELRLVGTSETRILEPRVMTVLVALARTPGEVVTKEQLIDDAWQGTPVTDNAITWAISRLRKALAPDGALIRTVTGQGYRLECDVTRVSGHRAPGRRLPVLGLGLIFAAAAALLLVALLRPGTTPPPATATAEPRRLTTLPGRETEPTVSSDGRWVAFSHRPTADDRWELRIVATTEDRRFPVTGDRGQATGELRTSARGAVPRRLPQPDADNRAPAWSPGGRQLAYFALAPEQCALRRMQLDETLGLIEDRPVTRCEPGSSGRVAWLSETVLLATLAGGDRHVLVRIDLATGEITELSDPGSAIPGDRVFAVSADRSRIALIRLAAGPRAELLVGGPDGGPWSTVGSIPYWFHALAFLPSGELAFNATDYGLIALDPADGSTRPLLRHPDRIWGVTATADPAQLIFESYAPLRSTVFALDRAGNPARRVISSAGTDRTPALAPDGTLAWVSDRTGTQQIWVREPGGEDRQFSDARNGQRFAALRWSPDSRRLLAVADGRIGSLGTDEASFLVHSLPDDVIADPSWTPDGSELRFSHRAGDGWTWVAVGVNDPPESRRPILADVVAGRLLPGGRIAHFRDTVDGLWIRETDGTRRQLAALTRPEHWWVDDTHGWLVTAARVVRVDLASGASETVLELGALDAAALAHDAASAEWLVTRYDPPESDIVSVSIAD